MVRANSPKRAVTGKKIQWITQEGLGGVGISSLQFDDPKGKCGAGPHPSHTMIGQMLKCRVREYQRRPPVQCTRLCYLNEEADEFDPRSLLPHWCSHFVLGSIDIKLNDVVEVSPSVPNLVSRINQLMQHSEEKPAKVILSIGAGQTNDIWRMALGSPIKRKLLISNIMGVVASLNASGVEISWTQEALDAVIDPTLLSQFLLGLRTALPKGFSVFLAANPMSSFSGRYNVDLIRNVTDLVILHTHRLHSTRPTVTEHHSPMFPGKGLPDSRMTVESFVKDWISRGMPREKLIVSVTSVPTSATLLDRLDGSGEVFGRPIGSLTSPIQPNKISSQQRQSTAYGKLAGHNSRTLQGFLNLQICRAIEDNSTLFRWMADSNVPVLVRGTEFVAFDNERSAKVKTTWSSLHNLGGMAIHGLPFDNPEGECPERPFPILQSIVDTQVCSLCAAEDEESKCSPSFQTICNYRLPEPEEAQRLSPATIPFERCSGIVVEHAEIDANASIHFVSKDQEEVVNELVNISFLSEYRDSTQTYWFSERFPFSGEEFGDFSPVFNAKERVCFTDAERRLSAWQSDLRSIYDVMALNSLHQVVLEPFTVPLLPETAFIHSPLFPISNQSSITSIDTIIRRWESSGLMRSKILLQIPSYGMEQLLVNRSDVGIGRPTEKEYAVIGQAELCQRLKYAGTVRETHWDSMSVNAWTTGGRWISIDDQHTVKYKVSAGIVLVEPF
ncbi:glycosyl hydrolase, family 18 [Cooperia oncophora]